MIMPRFLFGAVLRIARFSTKVSGPVSGLDNQLPIVLFLNSAEMRTPLFQGGVSGSTKCWQISTVQSTDQEERCNGCCCFGLGYDCVMV